MFGFVASAGAESLASAAPNAATVIIHMILVLISVIIYAAGNARNRLSGSSPCAAAALDQVVWRRRFGSEILTGERSDPLGDWPRSGRIGCAQ